jgi:hypothetical protein
MARDAKEVKNLAEAEQFLLKYKLRNAPLDIEPGTTGISHSRSGLSHWGIRRELDVNWDFDKSGRVTDSKFDCKTAIDLNGIWQSISTFLGR